MIGKPERFGVWTPSPSRHLSNSSVLRQRSARIASPRASLTSKPARTVAKRRSATAPSRGREARRLQQLLEIRGAGDEGRERRVRLGEAGDENDAVVRLAAVADDAVSAGAVRARLVTRPLADDPEAVGVVHVQDRVVAACDPCELLQIGGVAGHAVDAVHANQACTGTVLAQELLEVVRIFETEPLHRCSARRSELAAVVDRLVCPAVHVDRPVPASTGITDR